MGGNDHWIAGLAWFLISFISVTSQIFVFWPWLFGTTTRISLYHPSIDINAIDISVPDMDELYDPLVVMETQDVTNSAGTVSIVWGDLNVQALLYLVPFNFSLIMLCWNYYLTMTTNPGSPPLDWNPPADGSSIEYKKTTHTPRYCRTCDAYKPPRTHHCRTCKKCVLKMDHHCPWVRNCIGHYNYGHFVRFIIWTTIATFICGALLIMRCLEAYENELQGINLHAALSQEQIIWIVVNVVLDGSVFCGISILSLYHVWLISSNTTTIESWEKDRILTIFRRGKVSEVKCPYHQGILTNFQTILGQNPLLWLWPQPMLGDGMRFKVQRGKNDLSESFDANGSVTLDMSPGRHQYQSSVWKDDAQMALIAPWTRSFERIDPVKPHRDADMEMV
ncbi:Palmitoyltransferase [Podila epicladia]|nr:Palmitoyltransferase [Podila epicladia]